MIHLYTGNGKGKTTAAVGLAVRAAGRNKKVIFAQFMKGNETGEIYLLEKLPLVTILRSEKNFGFYKSMSEMDKEELTNIHNLLMDEILIKMVNQECDVLILDEITYPVKWNLLDRNKLNFILQCAKPIPEKKEQKCKDSEAGTLQSKADSLKQDSNNKIIDMKEIEIIMTGRDAADFMYDEADYITSMECVRHPYEKGVKARKGIEF